MKIVLLTFENLESFAKFHLHRVLIQKKDTFLLLKNISTNTSAGFYFDEEATSNLVKQQKKSS